VVADVNLDTATTVGRLVLTILAGVAEMESRRRSERMKDYHSARAAKGERAGLTYGMTTAASTSTILDIVESRKAGLSWAKITDKLNERQADGRKWHSTSVRRVFDSPATTAMIAA